VHFSSRDRLAVGLLLALASLGARAQGVPMTDENYLQGSSTKGVVLLSIRWDRKWKCAGFENAQLRALGFDHLPSKHANDSEAVDLLFDDAPLLMTKPQFDDYAYLVEPGEYALSKMHIKVARSTSDVGIFKSERDRLLKDGVAQGGSFTVNAGEVVYIGHFHIDCHQQPNLWRYYLEDQPSFDAYLAKQKKKTPALDTSQARFRLFKSAYFGRNFELK